MLVKCVDCMNYLSNKDNCSVGRGQGRKELHNDKFTCDGFIGNKESVKTMNRKEVVMYLLDNPDGKLRMTRDTFGIKGENKIIINMERGNIYIDSDNTKLLFSLYRGEDEAEFEVVRELRKMSFGEAKFNYSKKGLSCEDMKSCESGRSYSVPFSKLTLEELKGLWTIEGIYED